MILKRPPLGLAHIGIPTQDISVSDQFYRSIGFTVCRTEIQPNGQPVNFYQAGNVQLESYQVEQSAQCIGAIEHIALVVDDIDETFECLVSAGYEVLEGSVQHLPFWENGVRYCTIAGPSGEKFEFLQMM